MKTQNEIEIPHIVKYFFCRALPPEETPEGFVYVGSNTEMEFNNLAWNTKKKGSEEESERSQQLSGKYHIFVSAKEVIEYILSSGSRFSNLKPPQMYEVENYVKLSGLKISTKLKVKSDDEKVEKKPSGKKRGRPFKNTQQENVTKEEFLPKELSSDIKIIREVIIECVGTPTLKSLSGEEIKLEPGKHTFALIDSPREHEGKETRFQWLVLKDRLPEIFGKSVSVWHMVLGYNPLD